MFSTSKDSRVNRPSPDTSSSQDTALSIPIGELDFSYSRSQGPGGQNVNKVNSKVTLRWDFWKSKALTYDQKLELQRSEAFRNKINKAGEVVLHEQSTRDQGKNKIFVIAKLHDLVGEVTKVRVERIETEVPQRAHDKRLRQKERDSQTKERRRWRAED